MEEADSTDDACEEGSIVKAILDEEARWARKDEENIASNQSEGATESLKVKQSKAAYLAAQAYCSHEEAPKIDIRK